jgi:Ca2+-transporting ATPase
MTNKGMRVLAIAQKEMTVQEWTNQTINLDNDDVVSVAESHMMFMGLVGIKDPIKEGVKETIDVLKKGQINIVMITGDHPNTAMAIGKELDIITEHNLGMTVITGSEFENLKSSLYSDAILPEEINNIHETIQKIKVYARVTPEQKQEIVKIY